MIFRTGIIILLLVASAQAFVVTTTPSSYSFPPLRMSIPSPLDILTSGLVSTVRLPKGVTVTSTESIQRPIKYLYDVENDRDCRQVRERLTELDLNVNTLLPAAPNSKIWSSAGPYPPPPTSQLPHMVLANGQSLSGAQAILEYLDTKYPPSRATDDSTILPANVVHTWQNMGSYLAVLLRYGRGSSVVPAARREYPEQPLIVYSYEGNQFCRLVREVLCELDIPYELRNAGKKSPRRAELAKLGSTLCPFLIDPNNTDTSMPESKEIIAYLYQTYARWTPPNELLQWVSEVVLPLAKPLFALLTPLQAGSIGENKQLYETSIQQAFTQIDETISSHPVVVYTYSLSPFCTETKALLDRLNVEYKEVSLGAEWIPGLLKEPAMRAALLEKTGQSSLPHIFVGGESIGGLFSGTPGLIPLLETDQWMDQVAAAKSKMNVLQR